MSLRNLSPLEMFEKTALEHQPVHAFTGSNHDDFEMWKADAWPDVYKTLGDFPARVPLQPEFIAEWKHDGLTKQRWLIDVQKHIAATLHVNIPGDLRNEEKRPAILCWHGHGEFGKDSVMGNDSSASRRENIQAHNYDYGHQMAKAGYVTFAIDWIGAGERCDGHKPNHRGAIGKRDWCDLLYVHATMLGMTSISINVSHGMAATDFICMQRFVDADRLGVMGLSGGGTMTLWSMLCDQRFTAAEIICYSDLWPRFGFRDNNYCGMQVAPGLFKLVDLPDLQGLIAPRPLLVDIGAYDDCFLIDSAIACYQKVREIYQAANASGNLDLDLHPGGHGWGANRSVYFFGKHIGLE